MGSKYIGSNLHGMGDIRICSCYAAVRRLEHGMNVVKKVLEKGGFSYNEHFY